MVSTIGRQHHRRHCDRKCQSVSEVRRDRRFFAIRKWPGQRSVIFGRRRQRKVPKRRSDHAKSGVAKLSVVGIGMRSHSGVASRLFECLGKGGINIQLISTSEIKIAVVVDESDVERAAQLTHKAFGLANPLPISSSIRPLA